jgi:hypothetical protein
MDSLDATALALFQRQHGCAERGQLRSLGITDRVIGGWVTSGAAQLLQPRVLGLNGWSGVGDQHLSSLCLAAPTVAIGGSSAGRLWGLRQMPSVGTFVIAPPAAHPRLRNVRLIRSASLLDEHIVHRDDGLRFTSPTRTLFDLANEFNNDDEFAAVVANVRDRFRVSISMLHRLRRQCSGQGKPGSERFNRVLATLSDRPPQQSLPEIALKLAFMRAGLPEPVEQYAFDLSGVGRIYVDLAFVDHKVIVEFDHSHWHAYGKAVVAQDKRRDRQLVALGWIVVRFDEDDVAWCLADLVNEVAALLARRSERAWGSPTRSW